MRGSSQPRVLRVSHSAVVSAWRQRERELVGSGVDTRLVTARRWNEGGAPVSFATDGDSFAEPAGTLGRHPNVFVFDPRVLWRALRDGRWDVIDIHEEPCSLATAEVLLLRRLSGVRAPVVLYSAQNIDKRYPVPFRWLERHSLRVAAGLSVCNAAAGEILRRKGSRGVLAEIPLGVDVALFAPDDDADRDTYLGSSTQLRVGYVGRLERHKGVHVLLAALADVPDTRLDIVGAGPAAAELAAQAAESGIGGRVSFRGPLTAPELAVAYRSFDVLAVPSLPTARWLEQFGRVVVEAMASGVPVLASSSGALPDVVADAGLLVPPGDVAAWSRALKELHAPELRAELGRAGLSRAPEFTWAAVAERMIALYRRVGAPAPAGTQRETADRSVEVVVVAYGPPQKLDGALRRLGGGYPVTVVDNSSSAATAAVAAAHAARYLDPGRNLGFAAGVNYALARRGDPSADVLLLNPDAEIDAAGVSRLHAAVVADPRLACVGPAQVGLDGAPDRVAWPFPTPARAWLEAIGLSRIDTGDHFVIGSVLLIAAAALADVGGFDERFFLYSEETDWQRRARTRGWRVRLVPEVRAVHEGAGAGADPAWRTVQFTASLELYLRKHYGRTGWSIFRAAGIVGAAMRGMLLPRAASRRAARTRMQIYLRGPVRTNAAMARPGT